MEAIEHITATADHLRSVETEHADPEACVLSTASLLRVLVGVQEATEGSESFFESLFLWLSESGNVTQGSLNYWRSSVSACLGHEMYEIQQLANVTIAVAFLRERSRSQQNASSTDLGDVWNLIYTALTCNTLFAPLFTPTRSAQGFVSVVLCSLIEDGCIDELFRLHVWLPDGCRGNPDLAIHSHQPFAQSWVLAGEAVDNSYEVKYSQSVDDSTHSEYAVKWTANKDTSTAYKTHQISSTIENTDTFCEVRLLQSQRHTRDMSYMIPSKAFHATEVSSQLVHATLFYFDSSRGFSRDARVLGPKHERSFTQVRAAAGITAHELARTVQEVRSWENFIAQAQEHTRRSELEQAIRSLSDAQSQLDRSKRMSTANNKHYRCSISWERGNVNRRFGRYEQAKLDLEEALSLTESSWAVISITGELGVVQRHMNMLTEARQAFQTQYDTAKKLKRAGATCRAIGNLGMVNFQLYRNSKDPALLDLAISQLNERVRRARDLEVNQKPSSISANEVVKWYQYPRQLTIGLSRLSLCYTEKGDHESAIKTASESLKLAERSPDATITAMSLFFHGRSLLMAGQREAAIKQFNKSGASSPAIALCKEPSEEHHVYLQELVDTGASVEVMDENGYGPLDYTVFNSDPVAEAIVVTAIRKTLQGSVSGKVAMLQHDARLRKGYRELFQEHMRPSMLANPYFGERQRLYDIRLLYSSTLAKDQEKRDMFDELKHVKYSDFVALGRLPRSTDDLLQTFLEQPEKRGKDVVVLFSYARVNHGPDSSPDDENNTQYRRMVDALEEFLRRHRYVKEENLHIWVVR